MSTSLAPECAEKKDRYDACFIRWYSEKYLRGDATANECDDLFRDYRACLAKALKARGLDEMIEEASRKPGPGSGSGAATGAEASEQEQER